MGVSVKLITPGLGAFVGIAVGNIDPTGEALASCNAIATTNATKTYDLITRPIRWSTIFLREPELDGAVAAMAGDNVPKVQPLIVQLYRNQYLLRTTSPDVLSPPSKPLSFTHPWMDTRNKCRHLDSTK
jgi:hypothetical protein